MLNSDVYVMIPVQGIFKEGIQLKKDVDVDKYISKISEIVEFECKRSDYDNIERFQIGSVEFAYYKDDLLVEDTVEWIKCHLVLTIHKKSKLGILQMIFTQCEKEDSQIGGIVFSDKIKLKIDDKAYELIEFLGLYGLLGVDM